MLSHWPLSISRGPICKADILLDSTCFSLSDFESDTDFESDLRRFHPLLNPSFMAAKRSLDVESTKAGGVRKGYISNSSLDSDARYNHPTYPPVLFLTTFLQSSRFASYIAHEFPSLTINRQDFSLLATNQEPLRKEVNATYANTLLNTDVPTNIATLQWVIEKVFPDDSLPVSFNPACLDFVQECWDDSAQKFSHFPDATLERTVQDWLNHLAHTLGVKHGLIQPASAADSDTELSSFYDDNDADDDDDEGKDEGEGEGVSVETPVLE